jgi:hypothetical protein
MVRAAPCVSNSSIPLSGLIVDGKDHKSSFGLVSDLPSLSEDEEINKVHPENVAKMIKEEERKKASVVAESTTIAAGAPVTCVPPRNSNAGGSFDSDPTLMASKTI